MMRRVVLVTPSGKGLYGSLAPCRWAIALFRARPVVFPRLSIATSRRGLLAHPVPTCRHLCLQIDEIAQQVPQDHGPALVRGAADGR
jgi:hypothetical protein